MDGKVISIERDWYILTFAYNWLGEREVHSHALRDFKKRYRDDQTDDRDLCLKLWELFEEADIVVSHNGNAFDIKKANARFLYHGFNPPSPFKSVDTKQVAKRYFMFDSNSLDDLGHSLNLGGKLKHSGFEMWRGVMNNDPKAWKQMIAYNKQDVSLLKKVYDTMSSWITDHPNYNLYQGTTKNCPNCGSPKLQKRGLYLTRVKSYQRYQCQNCGAWSHEPKSGVVR